MIWWFKSASNTISIHAPRVGCDSDALGITPETLIFQSTHPVWGATVEDL